MKSILPLLMLLLLAPHEGRAQSASAVRFVEVPFTLIRNQIVVDVKIADKGPFSMLLDTGTDPSAVDLAAAKELGLKLGSMGYPASGGGTDANLVFPTQFPTVELGSVRAKDVQAGAIDLTKLAGKLGKRIYGVLGYSFLKDRIVKIDYPALKLRFYAETPYPGIQNALNTVNRVALSFRYEDNVLIDSVFINGQKMRATLDTGSSGTFALTPAAVKMLGLEEEARNAEVEEAMGYNGVYENRIGVLKSVQIGRLSLDSIRATFWLPGTGHDHKRFQVNIGNGFFKDFVVTFDFRNKIVVLEKPE